jgi:hypothetical protein
MRIYPPFFLFSFIDVLETVTIDVLEAVTINVLEVLTIGV